jgi:hypothetical protein
LISPRDALDLSSTRENAYQPKATELAFLLLGPGQLFGEEALLTANEEDGSGGLPLYSIRCKSAIGEVLVINEDDFTKRVKCNPRSLRLIEENCEQKAGIAEEMLENPCSYVNLPRALKQIELDVVHHVEDQEALKVGVD